MDEDEDWIEPEADEDDEWLDGIDPDSP